MTAFERIKGLYEAYLDEAMKLERDRKIGDGLFGIGKKPADDPCHDRFASDVEAAIKDIAEEDLPSPQIRELLGYMYHKPAEHEETASVYWMLIAVQGSTTALIPALSAEDADALCKAYTKAFRPWQRLPVQKQLCSMLKKAAKKT